MWLLMCKWSIHVGNFEGCVFEFLYFFSPAIGSLHIFFSSFIVLWWNNNGRNKNEYLKNIKPFYLNITNMKVKMEWMFNLCRGVYFHNVPKSISLYISHILCERHYSGDKCSNLSFINLYLEQRRELISSGIYPEKMWAYLKIVTKLEKMSRHIKNGAKTDKCFNSIAPHDRWRIIQYLLFNLK